jgi:putative heme-binding domain-containing protein
MRQIVFPPRVLDRNPTLRVPNTIAEIAIEGGAAPVFRISEPEPWRIVRTRDRAADPAMARRLPPNELVATGFFTSASGVTIFRGAAYGSDFYGNAFVGDVGGNLVHRKRLEPNGAIFRARRAEDRREFIASTDRWFRPVNFANTPNGTLLIIDMYRETIEHPDSIPEEIKRHLDLQSGRDRGRLYELLPNNPLNQRRPNLSAESNEQLIGRLSENDAWWRETAQRLLFERGATDVVEPLRQIVHAGQNANAAILALQLLQNLNADDAVTLDFAAKNQDPNLREIAARSLPGARAVITRGEPNPRVRFQAALTLGDDPSPAALDMLEKIAAANPEDPWIRTAVLSSIADRADAFLNLIATQPDRWRPETRLPWLIEIARMFGAAHDSNRLQKTIESIESWPNPDESESTLLALIEGWLQSGGDVQSMMRGDAAIRINDRVQAAKTRLARGDSAQESVVQAMRLVGALQPMDAARLLPPYLDPAQSTAVQHAAISVLARIDEPAIADRLIARWDRLPPAIRLEVIDLLTSRPAWARALLKSLSQKVIQSADLDPSRLAALLEHRDPAIREEARRILPAPDRSRDAVIAAARTALKLPPIPERGKTAFQKHCMNCHKAEGVGHDVGPPIETVAHRAPEDLLVQILDPNREVAAQYLQSVVALRDGRILTGIVASESTGGITLKKADGVTESIARDQVDSFAPGFKSLMPEGLERDLNPQALADLIAYIKGRIPKP